MSNVIVRAEREVFLATNYWQNSVASKFITNAIRELDRRAGERGVKVVMKIIYDRGSPKQLLDHHYSVSEKDFTGKNVGLPHPSEIPNIDLQVINFHTPIMGTFHAKYMVVDRKIALLQSNNIEDNDNLEMMVHLEGSIVDSLYDVALLSWHKKLEPPLPSYNSPAARGGLGSFGDRDAEMFGPDGVLKGSSVVVDPARISIKQAYGRENGEIHEPGAVHSSGAAESSDQTRSDVVTGPSTTEGITHPHPTQRFSTTDHPVEADKTSDHFRSNTPNGAVNKETEAYLNKGDQAIPQSQVQEPSTMISILPEHNTEHPHYDDDIAGEVARVQAAVSPKPNETRQQAVTRLLNHTTNKGFATLTDDTDGSHPPSPVVDEIPCPPGEEMTPYIPHPAHEPVPMALVNRRPHGAPNHKSVSNPQNAAWLSALRNAKKNVFIQSPTLNAEPLIPAIREACERGVDVYCYICLGYNDAVSLSSHPPFASSLFFPNSPPLTLILHRANSSQPKAATTNS